jgi:hypothetical protein
VASEVAVAAAVPSTIADTSAPAMGTSLAAVNAPSPSRST